VILGKFWRAFKAQLNKLAKLFWTTDPIAQMQYDYDTAVEQLKQGREGLEQYRALVERAGRQTAALQARAADLEARTKAALNAGQRDLAGKYALDLQKTRQELGGSDARLRMHEQAYNNNLTKIKRASQQLAQVQDKIHKYDADLKMSKAEAEMARLAQDFNFDVSTDFGQIEQVLQDKIGLNRARARVAADLSGEGVEQIRQEQDVQKAQAELALRQFEVEMGLRTPETTDTPPATKELGPARRNTAQG
jgi:phage shock protein A